MCGRPAASACQTLYYPKRGICNPLRWRLSLKLFHAEGKYRVLSISAPSLQESFLEGLEVGHLEGFASLLHVDGGGVERIDSCMWISGGIGHS